MIAAKTANLCGLMTVRCLARTAAPRFSSAAWRVVLGEHRHRGKTRYRSSPGSPATDRVAQMLGQTTDHLPIQHIVDRHRRSHLHSLIATRPPNQPRCSAVGGEASAPAPESSQTLAGRSCHGVASTDRNSALAEWPQTSPSDKAAAEIHDPFRTVVALVECDATA